MGRVPHVVDYQQTGSNLKLFGQREAGADQDGSPTDTGARLLDITDQLAVRLAGIGDPEPIHLEKTDTRFAFEWKGHYGIEGPAFVYVDRDPGRVTAIPGYRHAEDRSSGPI
jgi:hypothetical protein